MFRASAPVRLIHVGSCRSILRCRQIARVVAEIDKADGRDHKSIGYLFGSARWAPAAYAARTSSA